MKITAIRTFLMQAGQPSAEAITGAKEWVTRNWLFVKVYTDDGIVGIGECSGWPRVIETAIQDLTPLVIGEDPANIERLWAKMNVGIMVHGQTGNVGAGAMTGIEMALWDIKGKALNTPVWNLLGGKVRDRIRVYGHAGTPEHALSLKERGFTAVKVTSVAQPVGQTEAVRKAVGDDMDIMVDVAGPPRYTTKDAILVGKALEEFSPLFYEDPVAPENVEGLRQVRDQVDIPIAAGERLSTIWGLRDIIEDELVSVVQPDTGRAGGLAQLKKIAAMAEAHFISIAPHSGSLGPVAEFAALHLLASIPNALILERVEDDVPVRYQVIHPLPTVVDGYISVPDGPGLGVDIDEDVVRAHPSQGNVSVVEDREAAYEPGTWSEHTYFQQRWRRQKMLKRR